VWVVLVGLAALAAFYRSDDNDYWFHLAAGRSISQHGLPSQETWSLAAKGQAPWLSEWLFHVALYQIHRFAGDWGIALWRMAWTGAAMALAIRLAFLLGVATWSAVLLAPLLLAVARDRFQPRPEQIFIVFLLLSAVLFEEARHGRDRTRWLIPVQVLWANLQGSWVFGPAMAWIYAATAWLDRRRAPDAVDPGPGAGTPRPLVSRVASWAALGLVLWAASAIVPRPLETLARPFRFLVDVGVDPLTGSIEELRPWSWSADRAQPFTVLLGLWLVALLVGGQRMWRSSPALTLIAAGSLVLGYLGIRFRGLAAWMGCASLAIAFVPRGPRLGRALLLVPPALAGLLGMYWLVAMPQFSPGAHPHLYSVPVRAAALAESLHLEGPMLNTFHHGGYLLWARGEKNPPLVDGRGRGSLAFRSLYARAYNDPVALDSLLEQWDFNYLLIEPPQSSEDRLATNIARRLEWGLIFYDDSGLLYVRWNRYPQIANPRAYRYFTPDYLAMLTISEQTLTDPGLRLRLESELLRARSESPAHSRASLWLGLLALGRDDAKAAVPFLDEAYRIAPAMPGLALRQGMAHEMLGDKKGAIAAYRRAMREDEDRGLAESSIESLQRSR
jgi:hypothetical protein